MSGIRGQPHPVQQAYIAVFQRPDDVGLTGAFSGISEPELADLLAAAAGTPNVTFPLLNGSGQALGLAERPSTNEAAAASQLLSPVVSRLPGVTVNEISLTAFDLEGALRAVQDQRVRLLDQQLSSQVTDVQKRNARVVTLNAAITARMHTSPGRLMSRWPQRSRPHTRPWSRTFSFRRRRTPPR